MNRESRVRGVLLDWRGTLVHDPTPAWWIERAFDRIDRHVELEEIARLVEHIDGAARTPEFRDAELTIDCDADVHRDVTLSLFRAAGLDPALAHALYECDLDPACHPFYPDVADTLRQLRAADIRVAVVSDVHFDLRPEFHAAGLDGYVDEYVLSFEHGVQKPDPRIFEIALDRLGVPAADSLMVGDRPSHDGGAVHVGLPTLVFPPLSSLESRGLHLVLAAVGIPPGEPT